MEVCDVNKLSGKSSRFEFRETLVMDDDEEVLLNKFFKWKRYTVNYGKTETDLVKELIK